MSDQLPEPRLRKVYRLEATLAEPLDLGDAVQGHRRIAPLSGGTFETSAPDLDWLNKGVFISVGGRRPGAVIYETYLVE